MNEVTTTGSERTIGLDLGDQYTEACVLDDRCEVVESFRVRSTRTAMEGALARFESSRVVLEVGTHSPWVSRLVTRLGHEAVVANARRVQLITHSDSKNDRLDAEWLARLGRLDPKLLSPVSHRGEGAQRDLVLLRARDGLVRSRTQLINQVRGFAKSLGSRCPSSSAAAFPQRVREALPQDFFPGLETMLGMIEQLTREIRSMDRQIERLCRTRYPETGVMRQIQGVGPITALCFVLTLEDPARFAKSRSVGAYLGLRPRQRDSGDQQPQLRITKAGDPMLRRLLVQCAQYILGPFGPDTELRRLGLRLSERGGKAAKKRATVAVARRLAVLMHRLWVTGELYQPLDYHPRRIQAA